MTRTKIRELRIDDAKAIRGIQEAITKRKVSRSFEKKIESYAREKSETCLVAEVDGEIAGYIIGDIKTWGFGVEKSGWIEMVGVHPDFMGSGYGRRLGLALLRRLRKKKVKTVYTSVRWEWGDMISFFKSLGFERSDFINLERKMEE